MGSGFGPHGVITGAEIGATLAVIAFAFVAFVWMAYRTRRPNVPYSAST